MLGHMLCAQYAVVNSKDTQQQAGSISFDKCHKGTEDKVSEKTKVMQLIQSWKEKEHSSVVVIFMPIPKN